MTSGILILAGAIGAMLVIGRVVLAFVTGEASRQQPPDSLFLIMAGSILVGALGMVLR